MKFEIHNVTLDVDTAGATVAVFTLETDQGRGDFIEYVNENDGVLSAERTDSNLRYSADDVADLFNAAADKPELMDDWDYVPTAEIFDALDAKLKTL